MRHCKKYAHAWAEVWDTTDSFLFILSFRLTNWASLSFSRLSLYSLYAKIDISISRAISRAATWVFAIASQERTFATLIKPDHFFFFLFLFGWYWQMCHTYFLLCQIFFQVSGKLRSVCSAFSIENPQRIEKEFNLRVQTIRRMASCLSSVVACMQTSQGVCFPFIFFLSLSLLWATIKSGMLGQNFSLPSLLRIQM